MKQILIAVALSMLTLAAQAQTARTVTVNITPDGKSNMVVYLPGNPTGRAIVGCPGGGYSHLSMQNEGHDWADYFTAQGIAYGVLTYRMPNGDRNIPMGDARQAVRTMRDSAVAWRLNPYDVGIMGFSAGGHLASTTATHAEGIERPDFQILFYPVISMNERVTHKGSVVNFLGEGRADKRLVDEYSNDRSVRRHLTPPAVILMANDDRAVPPVTNGVAYYSAMRRAGNECAMYIYPTGGHGFGFRSSFSYHGQMLNDLTTWLQQHKAPRQDAVRVACIGNSITDGYGIDMAEQLGYPAQLQRLLGSGYHVRNYGVSARTLLNNGDHPYMKELAWSEAKAFNPGIVVIKLGTNDSKPANWELHKDEFAADLQRMIDELKRLPAKPAIYLCTPLKAKSLRADGDPQQIRDSVIVNGVIPAIRKAAKKNKLPLIDLYPTIDPGSDMMQRDGIHPTDKGARKMAETISEALLQAKNR